MTAAPTRARTGVSITLSGEIHLKSHRTQRRFIGVVRRNLTHALAVDRGDLERTHRNRLFLSTHPDRDRLTAATRVFGVGAVEVGEEIPTVDLDEIADRVVEVWGARAAQGSYAVRVRRRGNHPWKSSQAERVIGAALQAPGNRVDLDDPDHLIRLRVDDQRTWIATEHHKGPQGLPVGTQEAVACLISGGFDSAVAAWMLMSRGCPVHFVHFGLDCAQADHSLAVARTLHDRWGHGTDPMVDLVDFQPVKEAIRDRVAPRMRQIVLKTLMTRAAARLAADEGVTALATGEALGQVSTQTLTHLRSIDQASPLPILRPLVGMDKQSIIRIARRIGTADLSARAKEVCDLAPGERVAVQAPPPRVLAATDRVDEVLIEEAVRGTQRFRLTDWAPGRYGINAVA